jgi:hypothetical protein
MIIFNVKSMMYKFTNTTSKSCPSHSILLYATTIKLLKNSILIININNKYGSLQNPY